MSERRITLDPIVTAHDIAEARTVLLGQVERYADWEFFVCKGAEHVNVKGVLRDKTAEDFAATPVSMLVAIRNDPAQPAATRCAAMDAINERFLADDDTQAEIVRVANKLAARRELEDVLDRRERRAELARITDTPALALESSEA